MQPGKSTNVCRRGICVYNNVGTVSPSFFHLCMHSEKSAISLPLKVKRAVLSKCIDLPVEFLIPKIDSITKRSDKESAYYLRTTNKKNYAAL